VPKLTPTRYHWDIKPMPVLESVFEFLFEYCSRQGSSCPLVLVFLLCRLQATAAQSVFLSTRRKIDLFLMRLDASGFRSLLHQFPTLLQSADSSRTHSSSYVLSVMEGMYDEKRFLSSHVDTVFVPFHLSNIWTIQQDFYQNSMLRAWDTVPFQISSNTYVAQQYATEVERILRDSYHPNQPERSVCFVEIGAGHGILSYLLAKELFVRQLNGMVICTDFHETVFVQLLELPWVREVCAGGYLDFAVCGATASSSSSSATPEDKSAPAGLHLLYGGK
jgi:hypothetical protein